ncbi:hypothetical protein cypCar_00023156, partial [Cyprinus carpio]
AVLYLNDDFEGGDFFFADRDAKTVTAMVKPKCGRLVGFTSGPVNPHGVTAVTAGRRCALALWFTTEKQHRDMEREEAEELWAADGKSVVKEEKGEDCFTGFVYISVRVCACVCAFVSVCLF